MTGGRPINVRAMPGRAMTGRVRTWLVHAPAHPATEADRRTVDVLGLALPARASVVIAVVTFALLFDYSRTFLPDDSAAGGRAPDTMWAVALLRAVLFGLVPLGVVLLGFRDRPSRYGITLGDWRAGLTLVVVGAAVMTPIVLWFATMPDVRAFYGPSVAPLQGLLATNALDLTASEFLFRGFLMLTLVRVIGPLGVLVATMPFVFTHLGKPELELLSTIGGGLVYGWLTWRTHSILWGAIGHVYILTLVIVAAAG